MAVYDQGSAPTSGAARAGIFVQYAGAVASLALMAGIGVWGYKLVMRDVTGIPVVRAMTGDMRVLPANPGGEVSLHTGLAVNAVPAEGGAAAPEDTVSLAPEMGGLVAEDLEVQPMAEADEVTAAVAQVVTADPEVETTVSLNGDQLVNAPLSTDDILALADQIASAAPPLSELAAGEDVAPALSVAGQVVSASASAVRSSLRPAARKRRATAAVASVTVAPTAATTAAVTDAAVTTTAFAAGTKLVQLGAYPSADVAASEWDRLSGRFGDVMSEKTRVIQSATSGGRTFYRLRAQGFGGLTDARRFCAALVAEGADCIPYVVR